jgi:hypothetical protein
MKMVFLLFVIFWFLLSFISAILILFNKKTRKFFKREWKDIKLINRNMYFRIIVFILMIIILPITLKDSLRLVYHSLNKNKK